MITAKEAKRNVKDYEEVIRAKAKSIWELIDESVLDQVSEQIEAASKIGRRDFSFGQNFILSNKDISSLMETNGFSRNEFELNWKFIQELIVKDLENEGFKTDPASGIKVLWE